MDESILIRDPHFIAQDLNRELCEGVLPTYAPQNKNNYGPF